METIAGSSSELQMRSAAVIDDGGRSSKNHIKDTEDDELLSSAHLVLSNDDLLIEILLRSPAISIIRWKFVSKRCLSLITTPPFALRRSQVPKIDPPSGLFLLRYAESSLEYDFLPLDSGIPAIRSPPNLNFTSDQGNVEILQSCNGLLLCCGPGETVYVCNPSLNLFKLIPKDNFFVNIKNAGGFGGVRMIFDPTKSPHYKVIFAALLANNLLFIRLRIYSSETGSWSVYDDPAHPATFFGFFRGICWNDGIIWLSTLNKVSHLNLNEQQPVVGCSNPPEYDYLNYNYKLFESRGCLRLVSKDFKSSEPFNVYEMANENYEWVLKYRVNLDGIHIKELKSANWFFSYVRSFVLGETEDESFFVIEIDGKIFKYNIVLKTLSHLFDLRSTRINGMPFHINFEGLPFIASFAGV